VKIRELVWPHDRIAHISRHGVSPNEVEEVCFARSLVQEAKSTGENPVYGTKALRPVEKTMKTHDIPKTDSIEELARFWDAHDLTDFEDQLREVPGPIFERRPEGTVKVRLEPEEVEAVEKLAQDSPSFGERRGLGGASTGEVTLARTRSTTFTACRVDSRLRYARFSPLTRLLDGLDVGGGGWRSALLTASR
jgi:hypothetical protein